MQICVSVRSMLAESRNGRQRSPWAPRPEPGDRRRQCGGGAPAGALRGTRSDGPREARRAVGQRLAMPGRPRTPGAGPATGAASADADEHRHRFGRGVDQPDYASPPALRLVWSWLPLRASVTRRGRHLTDSIRNWFQSGRGRRHAVARCAASRRITRARSVETLLRSLQAPGGARALRPESFPFHRSNGLAIPSHPPTSFCRSPE